MSYKVIQPVCFYKIQRKEEIVLHQTNIEKLNKKQFQNDELKAVSHLD